MAEGIFLSSVAEGIIASLGSLTVKEIVQLWGAEGELEKLKDTVSTIKVVLLDAEEQQDGNPEVRLWLKKLKNPMYDADDLLDDVSSETLPMTSTQDKKKKNKWNVYDKSIQRTRTRKRMRKRKRKRKRMRRMRKSGSTTETPILSTIESIKTPVAEATRPWNLRTRRTASKFSIGREGGKGQRFTSRRTLQTANLTASLSKKKIEDPRTDHCLGVLVSERTVDSHTVSKSAENGKVPNSWG